MEAAWKRLKMLADIGRITLEDQPDWLKVVLPVKRNWLLFVVFTAALVVWLFFILGMLIFLIRDVILQGERFAFVFAVILLIWLAIWLWVGKIVWGRWQYYAAGREILFINKERLIIRRPVSIWGLTEAFDMDYVRPFYVSKRHHCPTFEYGSQKVYFGTALTDFESAQLLKTLNTLYFRGYDTDD
jgi:hypothetical protein